MFYSFLHIILFEIRILSSWAGRSRTFENTHCYILKILCLALRHACEKVFCNLQCCWSGSALFFSAGSGSVLGIRIRVQIGKKLQNRIWELSCVSGYDKMWQIPVFAWLKGTVSGDGFGFWWHVWLVLGLTRGRGQFLNFLGAPMILERKKVYSRG